MAGRKKTTRRKGARRKKADPKSAPKPSTRRERSAQAKADLAAARAELPLGAVPGLPEIPEGPWAPGDGATPEAVAAVLEQMTLGHSLRALHARGGYPSSSLWGQWIAADAELSTRYARARELRAEALAELAQAHAMGLHRTGKDSACAVSRDKLSYEALRWHTGKLDPKRYSDKVQLEHSGEVARPVKPDLSQLSDEELERLDELLEKAKEGSS